MQLDVIGFGLGRTGTLSLKLALDQLGLGPCHHMEEVILSLPEQVPLWEAAVAGEADWDRLYSGYRSAVDWPTAAFVEELYALNPEAKFILSHRDPQRWAESFGSTIYRLTNQREEAPPEPRRWLNMVVGLLARNDIPMDLDTQGLAEAFSRHNEKVRALVPASQLLEFQASDGWEPLCEFLDVEVPAEPYPRTNNREEFWDVVAQAMD
jgi:hypothetical protein